MKYKKNKTISINLWVSPEILKTMDRLAKKMKMNRSKYIRYISTLEHDQLVDDLTKKDEDYKKLLTTAKKAVFTVEKLSQAVNFQLDTGLKNEVIKDIKEKLKEIEKEKEVLKK